MRIPNTTSAGANAKRINKPDANNDLSHAVSRCGGVVRNDSIAYKEPACIVYLTLKITYIVNE
jgi:hypothetical protein